jgi:hypothetical protein
MGQAFRIGAERFGLGYVIESLRDIWLQGCARLRLQRVGLIAGQDDHQQPGIDNAQGQ